MPTAPSDPPSAGSGRARTLRELGPRVRQKDEEINDTYAKHVATIGELVATVKLQVASMVHARAALRPLKPSATKQYALQKAAESVTALKKWAEPLRKPVG